MLKRYLVTLVGACLLAGPVVSAQLAVEEDGGATIRISADEMTAIREEGGVALVSRKQLQALVNEAGEIGYQAGAAAANAKCGSRT